MPPTPAALALAEALETAYRLALDATPPGDAAAEALLQMLDEARALQLRRDQQGPATPHSARSR